MRDLTNGSEIVSRVVIVPSSYGINVPLWNGTPKEAGQVWTLREGERVASCHLWTHPLGGEVRLTVDGDWVRGETHREGLALVGVALAWRSQFEGKGWT